MKKLRMGPSAGWMCAHGVGSLLRQIAFLKSAGATAVEFNLGDSLDHGNPRVMSLLNRERFSVEWTGEPCYRSLHLPNYRPDVDEHSQAETAWQIASHQDVLTMLIHPQKYNGEYPVSYYKELNSGYRRSGIHVHLAIENMDKDKPDGFLLSELYFLVQKFGLGFVLDVQHACEHDASMGYAIDLFEAMRSRLVHLHVSGQSEGNNHCLLHRASNASAIVGLLGRIFSEMHRRTKRT